MSIKKPTQHEIIFYLLYKAYRHDPEHYTPIWKLIGEHRIEELDKYVFVSYEGSARMSELYHWNGGDDPVLGLFDKKKVKGLSGEEYYSYRITPNPRVEKIQMPKLLEFYKLIKRLE